VRCARWPSEKSWVLLVGVARDIWMPADTFLSTLWPIAQLHSTNQIHSRCDANNARRIIVRPFRLNACRMAPIWSRLIAGSVIITQATFTTRLVFPSSSLVTAPGAIASFLPFSHDWNLPFQVGLALRHGRCHERAMAALGQGSARQVKNTA
jgi:hypothetical protein